MVFTVPYYWVPILPGRKLSCLHASGAAPLVPEDAEAHCAGEGELTVRWLTGGHGTVEGTREYFAMLADNARRGEGRRSFGCGSTVRAACRSGRLARHAVPLSARPRRRLDASGRQYSPLMTK